MPTRKKRIGIFVMLLILGNSVSSMAQSYSGGSGTSGDPYLIANKTDIKYLSENSGEWSKHFKQTADISFEAADFQNGGDFYNEGSGYIPIGTSDIHFTGSYNGQSYAIIGLYINRSDMDYIGLFGIAGSGGSVTDVELVDADITGRNRVGGLLGENGGSVSYCHTTGSVNGMVDYVGGLVGYNAGGTVENSSATGSVNGTGSYVGGLVGRNYLENAAISNCRAAGSVYGGRHVGGLVGRNSRTVENSYTTGTVAGEDLMGGFTGSNSNPGTVLNSYARGTVTRNSGSTGTSNGGFVGRQDNAAIINCYSTGAVIYEGATNPTNRGFCGTAVTGDDYEMTGNLWDTQTSGQTTTAGNATGKTTAEMKNHNTFTAAGWDFVLESANGTNDYWDMDYSGAINNGYPFLSWENGDDISLPVELVSFSAHTEAKTIFLKWVTESETDNLGFILERSENNSTWVAIASYQTHDALKGQGNTSSRTEYMVTDQNVETGKTYYYRLSDVSTRGEMTIYTLLSIRLDSLPKTTTMENAYPNPFNPQTYIAYHLAESAHVKITVFDMLGRPVKELYNSQQSAGSYQIYWDGTDKNGIKASSGIYFIHLEDENNKQIQKVMFIK